jgi:hypothetical protein
MFAADDEARVSNGASGDLTAACAATPPIQKRAVIDQ